MKPPTVCTVIEDSELQITVKIYAYRELTRLEIQQSIAMIRQNQKGKRLKKGKTYELTTLFGLMD